MKTLVIFGHPDRRSFNGALLEKTLETLGPRLPPGDVQVIDLYQENFDPVLRWGPGLRRRDLHQVPEIAGYQKKILWAQRIIFIYPIWWGRPPAMIMGFIDRLFSTHFAYEYRGPTLFPEGLLKGREVLCISTMKGPPGYLQYWLWNAHRVLMKKALFQYVGIKKVKFLELAKMEEEKNLPRRLRALEKVERTLAACGV